MIPRFLHRLVSLSCSRTPLISLKSGTNRSNKDEPLAEYRRQMVTLQSRLREEKNTWEELEKTKQSFFFINLFVITVHRQWTVYELGDLFLEKRTDINAPFIDSANAVCAAIPVGEMKINRGSSAEIRHVFNY